MKNKPFINRAVAPALVALTAIALGAFLYGCRKVPASAPASDKYRLVWNDDPTSTMTVAWDQHEQANATVWYGTEDHGRTFWKYGFSKKADRILDQYEMITHFAKLTNLEADKAYYFVIKDDKGVSDRYWFRTAPDTPKAFTFIGGGDTKSSDKPLEAGRASNRLVSKLRPLFVMFNGDFCSGDGTSPERWHTWLTDWHKLSTTADGRMIPVFPVHGNHENGDHANLNYIFNAPYQDNDSSRIYYSLSFGGDFFHMIALNSEIDEGGRQRAWLESDLKNNENYRFKIAGYHKPFWPHTSGKSENQYQYNQWAHLFYKYGLDVSLDGDSHMSKITYPLRPDSASAGAYMGFVRDDENGTMFLGEGSWGAFPRVNDDDKPWTLHSYSGNQIKWIHVLPEAGGQPDRMLVYTVVSSTYDENEKQTLYDAEVEALTEHNLFKIPDNIRLVENGAYGAAVKYPFHLNGVEAVANN
ncbi:MAG: metallophosphoesterase family protein [Cytophagales bacterium]|nr:metallophosphoesterase family protein [Cytophagales bacterium]